MTKRTSSSFFFSFAVHTLLGILSFSNPAGQVGVSHVRSSRRILIASSFQSDNRSLFLCSNYTAVEIVFLSSPPFNSKKASNPISIEAALLSSLCASLL